MINLDDFEKFGAIKPIIEKINKYYAKNKKDKILKLLGDLSELMDQEENLIPITYIFSLIAEKDVELIPDNIFSTLGDLLEGDDNKAKLNSISVLGFRMLKRPESEDDYLIQFINLLNDDDKDVRENIYYFLQNLKDFKARSLCRFKVQFIEAIQNEDVDDNILSIINILIQCSNFSFQELLTLRMVIKELYSRYFNKSETMISSLDFLTEVCYANLNLTEEFKTQDLKHKLKSLDNLFLMKKETYPLSESNKVKKKRKRIKQLKLEDQVVYFYVKIAEEKAYYFYEFEKSKLTSIFSQARLSSEDLSKIFDPIVDDNREIQVIINTLLRFNHIEGYYSDLGFFYPLEFITSEFQRKIQENGMINLKKYDYFPINFIEKVIKDISNSSKEVLLKGKNETAYYSLKRIVEQINKEAAKSSSIDLQTYKERLPSEEYHKLVKNLPKEYLTEYHKDTHWITNLGLLKINQEIENSKILGYLSIPNVAEKYHISKTILEEVIENLIDFRSGVFDMNKNVFYYSRFLKDEIDKINLIKNVEIKAKRINQLAQKLNIKKEKILSKIDENLRLLGEEIKQKDQINIPSYLEKTGMNFKVFVNFIKDLDISYFKKGDTLVLDEKKVNEAKVELKEILVQETQSRNSFLLTEFDISTKIVKDLLAELIQEDKIKGIFYNDQGELRFYSEKGIINMMMEESFLFTLTDFFPDKELSEEELNLMKSTVKELMNSKKLNGTFDPDSLTFSSNDVVFAQNYNTVLSEFEKTVINYNSIMLNEFNKVKTILTKKEQTIFPQEIKLIQDTINRMNEKSIKWRHELDAFIRRANTELLKKQGYSIRRYKEANSILESKDNIKFFEDDTSVKELMTQFNKWIKLFNNIELKYGNVIFYQKRVINDPSNQSNKERLNLLLAELNMDRE
jgi:hypothetical protein